MSNIINFKIEGGKRLHGKVRINTSKNSAVGLLCASLLNRGTTTLKSMPRIEEVNRVLEVLASIGVQVKWKNGNDLEITPPAKINLAHMDTEAAMKTRSVIMLLAPLAHHLSKFVLP